MAKYLNETGLKTLWSLIKTQVSNLNSSLTTALNNEINRATTAETKNSDAIAAEQTRATGVEATKVDKVEGKALSANDFTDAYKAKLDGIEANAKNVTKVSQLENDSEYQTKSEVTTAIENVVGAAPEALDTLKELADALGDDANFASTITNKIASVQTNLDNEVTRAKAAESTNATAISTETKRAQTAENTLTSDLSDEVTRAKAAEKTNADAISAETTRAKAAENANATNIATNKTNIATNTTNISTLNTNLTAEIARAKAAEAELQASLDAMVAITDDEINTICV